MAETAPYAREVEDLEIAGCAMLGPSRIMERVAMHEATVAVNVPVSGHLTARPSATE